MKTLKLTNEDYNTLKLALSHAECWVCHLSNIATDEAIKEWAMDTLKKYIEVGFNVDVTGD